jgi:glycosyltransferase involved in cell wall biosynthesis
MSMKVIEVVTPCYNEEGNVEEIYRQIAAVMASYPQYQYRHLFIDNASTDQTASVLRKLAAADPRVRVILNARNFGGVRSMQHALNQTTGDAAVLIFADMQDPPEVIKKFIAAWEKGFMVVAGVKISSDESAVMYRARSFYYGLLRQMSDAHLINHFNGFGLYDRKFLEVIKTIQDPEPYLRGMVAELGFDIVEIPYHQHERKKGISKGNLLNIYGVAMLGLTSHSKLPLRLAAIVGFCLAILSAFVGAGYLVAKLLYWDSFPLGIAPLVVGFFFLSSVQLFFIGMLGEYVGAIQTQVRNRPLVVEKERINFSE